MSLESCAICGYAVSTTTHRCRHCSGSRPILSGFKSVRFIIASVIAAAAILAICFFLYR